MRTKHTAIRLPDEMLRRADALNDPSTVPGLPIIGNTRSDVLRAAIAAGLDVLEQRRTKGRGMGRRPRTVRPV